MKLGVSVSNGMTFTADAAGIASNYASISSNMSTYRRNSAQQVNFFDQGAVVVPDVKVDVDVKVSK